MKEHGRLHFVTLRLKDAWLSFTERAMGRGISWRPTRRKSPKSIPSNIFHRCSETPLGSFIDASVDHNLNALIKYGHAHRDDLTRAWEMIYGEYTDIAGSTASKILINLAKDIAWHDAKLKSCAIALAVLKYGPNKDALHTIQKAYRFQQKFDYSDPEQYLKDLEAVATRLSSTVFVIQQKTSEYERESKRLSGKPMTRQDWTRQIAIIAKFMQVQRIDPKVVTVTEFVEYRKLYEAEIEAMNKTEVQHGR